MPNTDTRKQLHFMVPAQVHAGIGRMADKANTSMSAYAETLFLAAYSARAKPPTGDRDLDAAVARVAILWAEKRDTAEIAAAVGLGEPTVVRILNAWRAEVRMGAAA